MTNESPHRLNPPPELFDLLCYCKEENPAQRLEGRSGKTSGKSVDTGDY